MLTKDIAAVVVDEGTSTTAYPIDEYGVIQGDSNTIMTIAVALGLDTSQIPEIDMTPELKQVILKRQKGQEIFNRFLAENEQIVISTEDNLNQLGALINVKQMLESGALATARDLISMIPGESFITTPGYASGEERKQSYIDELNTFINTIS